jgi:predicted PurR-regulated permease PerM
MGAAGMTGRSSAGPAKTSAGPAAPARAESPSIEPVDGGPATAGPSNAGEQRAVPAQAGPPAAEDAPGVAPQQERAIADRMEAVAEDRMEEAVAIAAVAAEETGGLGHPGRPMNQRSPFFIGMAAAAGVAVTYGLLQVVLKAGSVLILIGLALFISAGLDPAVSWLTQRGLRRWAAVTVVLLVVIGVIGGFLAAAIPPLASQTSALAAQLPHYAHSLQNHSSELGKLNARYHLEQRLQKLVSAKGTTLISGLLGAGKVVLGALGSVLVVAVLTVYFLVGLPRIKLFVYRLAPHSRRTRVILLGDEIFTKVGGYVLGNVLTSVIAGLGTFLWMIIFGIHYPVVLGLFVALLDLIPVVGSTIGGLVVTLVALTVSLPIAVATLGFYVGYRLAEDYLLVPRIMGRAVQVPAVVSVLAVLVGGTLLGIIGALVAIPTAAALRLWLDEVAFRRLDRG